MIGHLNGIITQSIGRFLQFFSSQKFFRLIIFFLVVESLWIALSAQYPMAFDESSHLGIIQIYANRITPFLTHQPANANMFGAVARDPSYLYHFLMSFPYRMISLFSHNLQVQVFLLRILNVGMFVCGVVIFYMFFIQFTKVSRSLIHVVFLAFILTPVIPMIAGQINYDNLFFLGTGATLYFTMSFVDQLRQYNHVNLKNLAVLLVICLLMSLVKYAYLPIFLGVVLFLSYILLPWIFAYRSQWRYIFIREITNISLFSKISIVALILISGVLFFQRYGINIIKYHTFIPDCNKVLSTEDCLQYSPWARNYQYSLINTGNVDKNILNFTHMWSHNILYGLFFTINTDFGVGQPLPIPFTAAKAISIVGLGLVFILGWKLFKGNDVMILLGVVIVIYVAALWSLNYTEFIKYAFPVAEQGRYLLPILLPLYLIIALAYKKALDSLGTMKPIVAVAVLLLFLQGGGVMTYIIRSDPSWYWPNPIITSLNTTTQSWLKMVIKG